MTSSGNHLSRQQLDKYKELSSRLNEMHELSKKDPYTKKSKNGKNLAPIFQHLGDIKKSEVEALTLLEKYLKTDSHQNPSHKHTKDLQRISDALVVSKKHSKWG